MDTRTRNIQSTDGTAQTVSINLQCELERWLGFRQGRAADLLDADPNRWIQENKVNRWIEDRLYPQSWREPLYLAKLAVCALARAQGTTAREVWGRLSRDVRNAQRGYGDANRTHQAIAYLIWNA